jgi:hypothetical protein
LAAWLAGAAVAGWILLVGALGRPAGGLTGTYSFAGADGREVEVLRRSDPRIDFPVPQRLDAAYLFHWDYERFGFPTEKPPYVIRWRGLLNAPVGGAYGFVVDASGESSLSIDGDPIEIHPDTLATRTLSAGLHAVALDYRVGSGEARMVLSWQPPGRALGPIGEGALAPDRMTWESNRARRFWGVLIACAGVFVLIAGAAAARRRKDGLAGRLWAAILDDRPRIALAAILLLAALLRFHDYALVPFHHETADEYQHAWEGWHLLHERTPAAWSTFPDRYPPSQTRDFRWFGDRYVLVRPYFDHPPLFSIPVGLLCSLLGAKGFLDCTLPVMRVIPILCSLAGLLLLYRLARAHKASERAALLACLVYATVPVIILGHRLVKAENLLALLFMGAVLVLTEEGRRSPRRAAVIAGVLSALALWTKATGIAVVATALLMLAARRRFKDAALVAAITGAGLALYLLYVSAYDLGLFLKVLQAQGTTKWVSLDAFQDLLGGKVVVKWFGRGTYLWLLMAAGLAAFGRARVLLLPVAVYAAILCLNADHRVIYGWYRIPLYPFFCVAAGLYLETMIEEADLYRALPFAFSAVAGALVYALPDPLGQSRSVAWLFAAVALVPFLPEMLGGGESAKRVARAGAGLLLVIFLLANVATVGRLLEVYAATRGQP